MRRLLHAVAALAVVVGASLAWAQPAHAAPPGLCSVAEWQNPAGFRQCSQRLQAEIGQQAGCVHAPAASSPTAGLAGMFTTRPESSLRSGVTGRYGTYGVGGYTLDTYDLGCLGTLSRPDLVAWNTAASAEFSMAAAMVGAANGLRERAYDPGSMWAWSDGFVDSATTAVFRYVFNPLGVITLAVAGLWLLWRAHHGEMSTAVRASGWALLVMVAVTGVARWPVTAAHGADTAVSAGLATVHSAIGPGPQHVPADKCVLGADACRDNRSVAGRSADIATEAVLYRPWLRAALGSSDSATALTYGPALYDATTLTWGEAAAIRTNPQLRRQILDGKAATWTTVAERIRTEDPEAYEHLQGLHGIDRAGSGMVAMLSAAAFAAFDIAASIVILFGFLIFRVAIILLPLLGTVGLWLPASGGVRRVFHMTVTAALNIVVFGAAAGLYLTAVDLIFRSALPGAAQMVAVGLVGAACVFLLRPVRRFAHTATGRSRAEDGLGSRLWKAGKEIRETRTAPAAQMPAAASTAGPGAPAAARPETAAQPARPSVAPAAVKIASAAAPSVAAAAAHPAVAAAVTTVKFVAAHSRQRPESGSRP